MYVKLSTGKIMKKEDLDKYAAYGKDYIARMKQSENINDLLDAVIWYHGETSVKFATQTYEKEYPLSGDFILFGATWCGMSLIPQARLNNETKEWELL